MTFACYRFPDRDTFRALAAAEGLVVTDEDGAERLITDSHTYALVEVGIITVGGSYDPETGDVLELPTVLEGFHVNSLNLAPEAWDEYLVIVNHPRNVFAGGPTQAPDTATLEAIAAS